MIKGFSVGLLMLWSLSVEGAALAQSANPSTNPQSTRDLELSAAQKQTLYTSARNSNLKNETPQNFQPIVGVVLPESVPLQPMPKTVAELVPRTKDFQVAMVANQVVIVDPKERRVIEVIAGAGR